MAENETGDRPGLELDSQLVPLRVAARIAYFQITDSMRQVTSHEDLAEIVHLVAIALSTVAPIHRAGGVALTDREVQELLYRPLGSPAGKPELDAFCIRRGDLRTAMVTLKEARIVFGK